ncbi:thiamine phosphate synthase [Xanthomonas vesicatoria]|uniref:Thiamine-phosphate synthase n=2 Tax=Xanthomonas vesicatoria TaxID=56460 RepID=A0AAJ0IXL2_9XANT|nr:thiamine phosphate synthase [Xanthomonas vesicatoria]APO95002.1 thiamine-phosphate diphosphorylase [Xanthomonas vesicatoria]APP75183.1 thiamine-phosphate diphosphorylase [Xanthomonas vesicatoria ATCC 35937]EGD08537.1 thiamine-phosphate diphosphorylase [Xanthomonas vesicatoria ATCC 35937]KHM93579.1 thiamine-phosphate pyrophosphorylase [Xanthomonas vesicatoria]KHM96332.1 thiamine-phosphate pyrophosphorylase [Xanthomonas vesicatoria]
MPQLQDARGVYLITPDDADTQRLLARTAPLLSSITWLQYRNKQADTALRRRQATALREACAAQGVPLIINDDAQLAVQVGAHGVHLGEDDGDVGVARAVLGPQAIIGVSCYDDIARARAAVARGASYVAFGAFFQTTTKVTTRRATPALLQQAADLGVPRVAIGGIAPAQVAGLVTAGADLIAVVSGVYAAPDPVAALQAYRAGFAR